MTPATGSMVDAYEPGLYERIVRGWVADLPWSIRRLHFSRGAVRGSGTVDVRRGESRLARIVASALRFPATGTALPLEIRIARGASREAWLRSLGGRPLRSTQYARGPFLAERFGALELPFRVAVLGEGLVMSGNGGAVHVGVLRIPLPARLAPLVRARVVELRPGGAIRVHVQVRAPFAGLVLEYEGILDEVTS